MKKIILFVLLMASVNLLVSTDLIAGAVNLDASFDDDGKTTTDFSGGADKAQGVVLQSDGKIVVGGYAWGTNYDFGVARYNTDGSLDTSFDTDGKVTTVFSGNEYGYDVTIQSDSKIIVVGSNGGNDCAVARYNTNGGLDTSFDTDGKVTTDFGDGEMFYGVAIQSDSKIVAVGYTTANADIDVAVARYNTDGSLDTSFDTDGKLRPFNVLKCDTPRSLRP